MFTLYNRIPTLEYVDTIIDNFWSSYHSNFEVDESNDSYSFSIELPGFEKSEIKIATKDNYLQVKANTEEGKKREKSIRLPTDSDPRKTQAKLKNGILHINIPKKQSAKSKKIKVE